MGGGQNSPLLAWRTIDALASDCTRVPISLCAMKVARSRTSRSLVTSPAALARWSAVGAAALGTVTAVVNAAKVLNDGPQGYFNLAASTVAVIIAGILFAISMKIATAGRRADLYEGQMQLRTPIKRANRIDGYILGVKPSHDKALARDYLPRTIDGELYRALAASLRVNKRWYIDVAGRASVGKTRSLVEMLARYDKQHAPLYILAPVNSSALHNLLSDTARLLDQKIAAVLLLDDIESFIDGGLTTQHLLKWRDSGPHRIVAATSGSNGTSLYNMFLASIEHATVRVKLAKTTAGELAVLQRVVPPAVYDLALTYGLPAYLAAGPLLAMAMESQRHPTEMKECPEGWAVARAAIDWRRCGRTDSIATSELRKLWPLYVNPGRPCDDDRFKLGLDWAFVPVAGEVSLLWMNANGGVFANASVALADLGMSAPPDEVWQAALGSAAPLQAFSVGAAALKESRLDAALAGFEMAASEESAVPPAVRAVAAFQMGMLLLADYSFEKARQAFRLAAEQWSDDADPGLRNIGAAAWFARAELSLNHSGAEDDEPQDDGLSLLSQLVERYFSGSRDPAIREWAYRSLLRWVDIAFGHPHLIATKHPERTYAIAAWNRIIEDFEDSPRQNLQVNIAVAETLLKLGRTYFRIDFLTQPDSSSLLSKAIEVYRRVVRLFGTMKDSQLVAIVNESKIQLALAWVNLRATTPRARRPPESLTEMREGLFRLDLRIAEFDNQIRENRESISVVRTNVHADIAKHLVFKARILGSMGGDIAGIRAPCLRVIQEYRHSVDPLLRERVCSALLFDAQVCSVPAFMETHSEVARLRCAQIISAYSADTEMHFRRAVDEAQQIEKSLSGGRSP